MQYKQDIAIFDTYRKPSYINGTEILAILQVPLCNNIGIENLPKSHQSEILKTKQGYSWLSLSHSYFKTLFSKMPPPFS